jgi:amino acid transporter
MVLVSLTMIAICIWLVFDVAGQSPGLVPEFFGLPNVFPLSRGYGTIFGTSKRFGTAFALAPCFVSCVGYLYVAARQFHAMARSGLLPSYLKQTLGRSNVPIAGMLAATAVGLIGLGFAWKYDPYTLLFRMAVQGGCVVYVLILCAYIQFKTKFGHMTRQFVNPLGVTSAVVGILVFFWIEISLLFVLPLRVDWFATIAFFSFVVAVLLYYYLYAKDHQSFSAEEQQKFMKAYIINGKIFCLVLLIPLLRTCVPIFRLHYSTGTVFHISFSVSLF